MLRKESRIADSLTVQRTDLSTAAARCKPCYRRMPRENTNRGDALLEEEAARLQNCAGGAHLKRGRVLAGLRGAVLIRCHYAEWDCYNGVRGQCPIRFLFFFPTPKNKGGSRAINNNLDYTGYGSIHGQWWPWP